MATSAFRSTTKRSSIGGADDTRGSESSGHRRQARSVSCFSHRLPSELIDFERKTPLPSTRKKFVNTVRGAGFPEISLDDLAIELFSSGERGRNSQVSSSETAALRRRGRSVSRQSSLKVSGGRKSVIRGRSSDGCGNGVGDGRRRRSLSAVRYRASDSESDHSEKYTCHGNAKTSNSGNKERATFNKQISPTQNSGLRRCSSQRDFWKLHGSCSSQSFSSNLTDDEACDACYGIDAFTNLQSIFARKKSDLSIRSAVNNDQLEAVQNNRRNAVEEIRMGLQQVEVNDSLSGLLNGEGLDPKDLDALQAVSTARRSCSIELKQSEKLKQELLAEIMLEEQRGKEIKRIVGKLISDPKETYAYKRPARSRKRSNDKLRIPKQLNEEADKIIEDFISSVEDNTDMSSFDGERSDTSSTFGISVRPRDSLMHFGDAESYKTPPRTGSLPVEMDGVVFPWLQWETSTDETPKGKDKQQTAFPNTSVQDSSKEPNQSSQSNSSRGSCSPALAETESTPMDSGEVSRTRKSQLLTNVPRRSKVVDIDDYLVHQSNEELLVEHWKLRNMISSGSIRMCEGSRGSIFL